MLGNWTCPYCPQCLHPAEVHVEDPGNLGPMCCVNGCRCGSPGAPVARMGNAHAREDEMTDQAFAGGVYRDGGWSCSLEPDAADQVHGDPLADSRRQLQEAERALPDDEADLFRDGSAMRAGEPLTFTAVRNAVAGMCRTCMRQLPAHQYWCDVPGRPAPVLLADTGDWNTAPGGDDLR